MKSPSSPRRRARPHLGTLVDITLDEADEARAQAAFEAAFASVARVHHLMSAHDPDSELRRLSESAHRRAVRVHPDTARVLRLARAVHAESKGIFDVAAHTGAGGCTDDIVIDAEDRVHFKRPLRIDLGGIAKGFAVDCAIEVLQARGVASALVNAGGDMRCFGPAAYPVHLRFSGGVRTVAMLKDAALAASCNAVGAHANANATANADADIESESESAPTRSGVPHIDARTGLAMHRPESVLVQARCAAVADALTKVAMVCAATADRACLSMGAQWRSFDYHAA